MNYKKIALILLGIGLITTLVLSFFISDDEKYFNQVELSGNNNVVNSLNRLHYCDTILAVGLDGVGLNGVTVVINDLSEASKNQFSGELKAHVRLFNGVYYLFLGSLSRAEAIEVIAHEIVHIQQYESGEISYENGILMWQGVDYTWALEDNYESRPWERDAFSKQNTVETAIYSTLY